MQLFDNFLRFYEDESEYTLEKMIRIGFVYFDPTLIVLAMPITYDKGFELDLEGDTWFVMYASGDMKRMFEIMPYTKKWAAFQRNKGPMKKYDLAKIQRRICNG